ncbi:MAG: hypothetical protein R3B70_29745 [Polyangiaceae bacterium]
MSAIKPLARTEAPIARTIRFPPHLRERLGEDAERCGRSFEAQVIAILRRHYGEDVDIAPAPESILSLARGSLAGISRTDQRRLTRKLREGEEDEDV